MLHIAAHIEEPKHPQEVEPALSLPVDSLSVIFPVCCQGEPPPHLLPGSKWCTA